MPITTTPVGRAKLLHPDLGFDNGDGGTLLHAKIATMWTAASDHLPSRYSGPNTLAAAATLNIVHDFGLAIGRLKFIFFEAGAQLTEAQVAANYTVTQISVDEIQITNITGGSLTFSVMILAFRLGITQDDVDPAFSVGWDINNGDNFKNSLYKNGNFTHSTANEYYDMYIVGDLILGANLIVHGNLYVTGQIYTAGTTAFSLTVKKNLCALSGATISTAGDFTVGGDLFSLSTFSCQNKTSPTKFSVIIGGDLIVEGLLEINGIDGSTGVDNPLPGCDLIVRGDAVVGGISTGGSREGTTPSAGAAGGSVTIYGNLTASGTVNTVGGNGLTTFNGGAGGAVVIGGNAVIASTGIFTTGGSSGGSGTSIPGISGTVEISGNVLKHKDFFTTAVRIYTFGKPSSTSGQNGAPGASIKIGGNCHVGINSFGGGGSGAGSGGAGGAVTIKGNAIGDSAVALGIATYGGSGLSGGNGGAVIILGNVSRYDSGISADGGSGNTTGAGGDAGAVTIYGDVYDTPITMPGGNVGTGSGAGLGGQGGTLTLHGNYLGKNRSITLTGGNQTGTSTGRAGSGGSLVSRANVQCTLVTASAGTQPATSITAGSGGSLTVNGDFKGNFTSVGSSAISATSVNGGNSGTVDVGGSFDGTLTLTGGNGLTGGGKTGNIIIGRDLKGVVALTGGNAVATSGAATGGNIGTGGAPALSVGGDTNVTTLSCVPGNAVDAGLTTGTGGSYGGTGTNAILFKGNLFASGAMSFKGGNGYTVGGNSGEVRLYGSITALNLFDVSGGNAVNGTGQAGKVAEVHIAGGGFIDSFKAVPTAGVANTTVSTVYLMGYLTIREWNVSLTYYPATFFLQKLNSAMLSAGSMSAMIMITTRTADGGTDGTDALNDVFPRTGTAAQAAIQGRYNGANTVWKYRTFNNT